MRAKEFVTEHKKNRRAVKYNVKPQKPRNLVAKNASATTSGAGAHTDKKKASKQGYEKHKNKQTDESFLGDDIGSAQHSPIPYFNDLYVENTPEGVIIYAENIEGGYIDRDGGEGRGYFGFSYNITTDSVLNVNAPEDDYGMNFPDEDSIRYAIDDIVDDFKRIYGTTWEEIDDELNGGVEVDVGEGHKFPMAGKDKQGPAGQWRNKGPSANRPAKRGDLVGGSM